MKLPKPKEFYKNRLPRLVGNLSDVWSDTHDMLDSKHVDEVISNYMHNTTDLLRNENGHQSIFYEKETSSRNPMNTKNISKWLKFESEQSDYHHDRESRNTTQNDGPPDDINKISIELVIILTSSITLVLFTLLVASFLVYKVS